MQFDVHDPDSGKVLTIEGDSPPTEDELHQIFSHPDVQSGVPQYRYPEKETGLGTRIMAALAPAVEALEPITPSGVLNQPARLAKAITGETYADPFQAGKPAIHEVPMPQGPGVISGLGRVGAGLLNTLQTPESLTTLPLAGPSIPLRAIFGGQMAAGLPEQIARSATTLGDIKSTPAEKTEAALTPVVTAAMLAGLSHTKGEPNAPEIRPQQVSSVSEYPGTPLRIDLSANSPEIRQGESPGPVGGDRPAEGGVQPPQAQIIPGETIVAATSTHTPSGQTFSGMMHPTSMESAFEQGAVPGIRSFEDYNKLPDEQKAEIDKQFEQGFLTNKGRVVSRQEAADIGQRSGQMRRAPTQENKGADSDDLNLSSGEQKTKTQSTAEKILKVQGMTGDEFIDHVKGSSATKMSYDLAKSVPSSAIRYLEAARDKAAGEVTKIAQKENPTDAELQTAQGYGAKSQYFSEAIKMRKAMDEASALKNPNQEQLSEIEKRVGVGSGNGKELGDAIGLKSEAPKTSAPKPEPELIGMGGAVPSEFGEGSGADKYGIAERVREQRAAAGQVVPVEPGQGISARESIQNGRDLLQQGANPEQVLSDFEKTKRLSSEDMAVVRAHGENLAKAARIAESKFGTDSDEYAAAWQRLSDWDSRSKAMQTEWHKSGQAQQGETDLDTGSFTGLRQAYTEATGKDFTPEQSKEATRRSTQVRTATADAEVSKQKLFKVISEDSRGMTDAEKRAFDAANKTVREWAVRRAEAENKARVADVELDNAVKKVQEDATRKALSQASKTVRNAAIERAEAENKARVERAKKAKQAAQAELDRTQKALDSANKVVRDNAVKSAEKERKNRANPELKVWERAKYYIDKGEDNFDSIRNKVATDLGMKVEKVTKLLAYTERTKRLANDLWNTQQKERLLKNQAKRWVQETAFPEWKKYLKTIPNWMFDAKIGFGLHGFVPLGTHAPMVFFKPLDWGIYFKNYARMGKMVFNNAFYEQQIQDLVRRPNYITARRSGLQNDPAQFEDFSRPETLKFLTGTNPGNRGYSVLKMLRQDLFDDQWNRLPKSRQTPDMAKAVSDAVNHITGVTKYKPPGGAALALFAPRLELSRAAFLVGDPMRAADTFLRWNKASDAEKYFAVNQVKEKAWILGTAYAMLLANQAILSGTDSDQKVNFTDPMKSDFLKFKGAGMKLSYGNPMLTMARLPVRLYAIRQSNGGKLKNLIYPDEDTYSVLGEYARSQASPFASLATTLWLKGDWQNRPLPNSTRPVPKRLRAQGVKPYTWPEFWTEQVLPIPAEEAAREVWKNGLGMSDEQQKSMLKALATISVMSATGARLEDDIQPGQKGLIDPYSAATLQPHVNNFQVGQTINRGGKNWKVTSFDKDGEPLVEPVQ